MIAAEVALAFNGINERKSWVARPYSSNGSEAVHFTTSQNLVTLVLECDTGRFQVRFNKLHAAWGDYIRAISRSLYVVLNTLKAAGLPFDAPADTDGIEIVATATATALTYVRWPHQTPETVETAIMPELAGSDEAAIARGLLTDAVIAT